MAEISNLSEIKQSRRRAVRGFVCPSRPTTSVALNFRSNSGSKEVRRREGCGKNDNTG
jgi:hypothetical protein